MATYDDPPDPKIPFSSWKATETYSADDTLYLVVDQQSYYDVANFGRQTAWNAIILKSTDHG
jgi:hypothetical protein